MRLRLPDCCGVSGLQLVLSGGASERGVILQGGVWEDSGLSVQDHQELLHQLPPEDRVLLWVLLCVYFLPERNVKAEAMNMFFCNS